MGPSIFYLHGFASSAKSTKAAYLGERFRRRGLTLHCPDFNQPEFATLTLTRMLEQLDREMAAAATVTTVSTISTGPATLIGSSLGGTLAILAAAAFGARVDRLVLLAPAVALNSVGSGFSRIGPPEGGPHEWLAPERIAEWRRLGRLPFFHYADNAKRMLNFTFYEDSFRYNPLDATFSQPTLVFQGTKDTSVDPRTVEAFARVRPNVTLSLLEDDHQLTNSLPRIWDGVSAFLEMK
jgi:pimeloyl-ACP methyl ester carboxylesterase